MNRAYPGLDVHAKEIMCIRQFTDGLTSFEARKHVLYNHPATLAHAVSLAEEYFSIEKTQLNLKPISIAAASIEQYSPQYNEEDYDESIMAAHFSRNYGKEKSFTRKYNNTSSLDSKSSSARQEQETDHNGTKFYQVDAISKLCNNLIYELRKLCNGNSTQTDYKQNKSRKYDNKQNGKKQSGCFKCGDQSHYIRDCPLAKEMNQENEN